MRDIIIVNVKSIEERAQNYQMGIYLHGNNIEEALQKLSGELNLLVRSRYSSKLGRRIEVAQFGAKKIRDLVDRYNYGDKADIKNNKLVMGGICMEVIESKSLDSPSIDDRFDVDFYVDRDQNTPRRYFRPHYNGPHTRQHPHLMHPCGSPFNAPEMSPEFK